MIKKIITFSLLILLIIACIEIVLIEKNHVNYFRDGVRNVEEVLTLWDEN